MHRKPLGVALVGLIIVMSLLIGCRRSAVPPVEELAPEEATAVMQEAEGTSEEPQEESPIATDVPEPTEVATVEPPEETEPAPEPTPEPTATTPLEEPTEVVTTEAPTEEAPAVSGEPTTYVVQPGDNLFRIALRHNTTVQAVAQANNITNPSLIYVGQTLTIPGSDQAPSTPPPSTDTCSTIHVVQPSENLFRIGLRYNYSQYYLAQVNGISNPSLVYVGQEICIP